MKKLTVGSCFSGIGGLELGLEWTGGFETKWQIENDAYASAVLRKHWPGVKRYGDITTLKISELERVDVICGGYPCQPFSFAGRRTGETDPRHLWPYMRRAIANLEPRFVILENVPGHLSLGFGRVLGDLADWGYDAEWGVLSAAGVGAPHLRRRVFIVAHANSTGSGCADRDPLHERRPASEAGREGLSENTVGEDGSSICDDRATGEDVSNASRIGERKPTDETNTIADERNARKESRSGSWWSTEPGVGRVAHGVSSRVDRLRCLGNAVVPQVAQKVGEMILRYEAGL